MFYKEEDISNQLICPKCKNRFDDPRILPCGNSLCQSCILDEISEGAINKCYCCEEKHSLPKEGEFTKNKFILKQLEKKPIIIERGALGKQLKKKMIKLGQKREELETYMKNRNQIVSDYLSEIRTQIDLITETQIERLIKARDNLLDNLKQYQTECINAKITNQDDFLANIDDFNEKIMKYLNGISWKEAYINDQLNEADKLIDLCSKARTNFEKEIFLNKKTIFNPSVTTLNVDETIGTLISEDIDSNEENNSNSTIVELLSGILFGKNKAIVKDDSLRLKFDDRFTWLINPFLSNTFNKIPKKCDQIYLLSDHQTFLSVQTNEKLCDSIIIFNEKMSNIDCQFRYYNKHFLLKTEFHVNNLFLRCCDSNKNVYMLMCHYSNGQWSRLIELECSYQFLKELYNMAANDTHLYCFHRSLVFSYEYQRDKIFNRKYLSYKIPMAENARRVKVDSKFFYILNESQQNRNTSCLYIYDIIDGVLLNFISKNYSDIFLIEDGLIGCLYNEINILEVFNGFNIRIDLYDVNSKNITKKKPIALKYSDRLNLEIIYFSIEIVILFDKMQSKIYSYRKDNFKPCLIQ